MDISPFLSIALNCDETLQWVNTQLTKVNLHSVQTFDLHEARVGLHDCPCPHHETDACDCQMVVVLVYGETMEPATLILHGNNGQTWLSIADTPDQKIDPKIRMTIKNALEEKLPT